MNWAEDYLNDDRSNEEDTGTFYCPYTNRAECALIAKGWQPQELCDALECDQLKLFRRSHKQNEAA